MHDGLVPAGDWMATRILESDTHMLFSIGNFSIFSQKLGNSSLGQAHSFGCIALA